MAIVQISRITHRKGLSENLPQLAGAEFGWVIDDRKLYIGNGTLEEGAPVVGNTEILTEFSDILNITDTYTYKGEQAGYTVQTGANQGTPVTRTLQQKLDDTVSVRDFGAVGDGSADDTAAINRALFQLFCREVNTEIRRSILFPAGTYRVTGPILIPPFAKLVGEGANSTTIKLNPGDDSTYGDCVARTCDNEQQTGVSIGNNGAITPKNIEIYGMTFESSEAADIFLVEDATQVLFESVNFKGPLTVDDLTTASDPIVCLGFASTPSLITTQINLNSCRFSGTTYAMNVDENINACTISNSKFDTLYQGVRLGAGTPSNGGPVGVRLLNNIFDNIAFEGVIIGDINLNVTSNNVFLDVANNFQGIGNPIAPVISIQGDNNASIGDLFSRTDGDDAVYPRIDLNSSESYGLDNASKIKFGIYEQEVGRLVSLNSTGSADTIFTLSTDTAESFTVTYQYRDPLALTIRYGTLTIVAADADDSSGTMTYVDDYSENNPTGFSLSVTQSGSDIDVDYTASEDGTFKYTVNYLV